MVLDIEADAEMTTATKLEQTDEDMNQIGSIYECEFHDLGGKKSTKMTGKQVSLNMYFPSLMIETSMEKNRKANYMYVSK